MQKNLIILLSLQFSLLNTGYGLYSIFDEIPCTVPVLYAGDTIRVFNLNEYRQTNPMEDLPFVTLEQEDIKVVNQIFHVTKYIPGNNSRPHGILIDVKTVNGERFGVFMDKQRYSYVNGKHNQAWFFPEKVTETVRSLVQKYQRKLPPNPSFISYSHFPMCFTILMKPSFNFSKGDNFLITFYVRTQQSRIIPFYYHLYATKKKGIVDCMRDVPIWERLSYAGQDDNGLFLVYNESGDIVSLDKITDANDVTGEALEHLLRYFPNWSQMTERERMETLDKEIKY